MSTIYNFIQFITIHPDTLNSSTIPHLKDGKLFLFDIDETLYKSSFEMHQAEIGSYMRLYNNLTENITDPPKFRELLERSPMQGGGLYEYFKKTAMEAELLRGVFPYSKYLTKDIKLKETLKNLPYRKFCFTNGTSLRAEGILRALGLEDSFEAVICVHDDEMGTRGKPFEYSYSFVESLFNIKDNGNIVFFDDKLMNIEVARKRGWNGILVNKEDDIRELIKRNI